MPSVKEIANNPQFTALPPSDKLLILRRVGGTDPEFKSLPSSDQEEIVRRISGYKSLPGETMERDPGELPSTGPADIKGAAMQIGKQAAFPVGGQIAGAALGSLAGPLAPVAVPTMEALGGMGGEAANQLLGVTQPSLGQILMAGAAGPVGRAIGYAGRSALNAGMRALPGAAVPLNEMAIAGARNIPRSIAPVLDSSEEWYQMLERSSNPTFTIDPLKNAASKLMVQQNRLVQKDTALVSELNDIAGRDSFDFATLRERVKFWSRMAEQKAGEKSPSEGAYKLLSSAGHDLLEAPPGVTGPQASILSKANALRRREYLADELSKMIENSGIRRVGDQYEQLNVNPILSRIEDLQAAAARKHPDLIAKRFVESFEPGELEALKKTLTDLGRSAPKIPVGKGVQFGSGLGLIRGSVGALAGGGYGYARGEDWRTGAEVGAAASIALPWLLSKALLTRPGRAFLSNQLPKTATFDQQTLSILSAVGRSATQGAFQGGEGQ